MPLAFRPIEVRLRPRGGVETSDQVGLGGAYDGPAHQYKFRTVNNKYAAENKKLIGRNARA
jgi:hypothetical protein